MEEEAKWTDGDLEQAKETIEETLKEKFEAEIEAKENALREKEEELEKLKNKDMNFEALRKGSVAKDDIKKEIDSLKAEFEENLSKLTQAKEADAIEEFADSNIESEDDKKLWEHYFKKTSNGAVTKKEMKEAMEDALLLLKAKKGGKDALNGIIPTKGRPSVDVTKKTHLDADTMEKVGLDEETVKKYKNFQPIKFN